SAADAQAHFKMTLLNARKGFYAGTWVQTKGPGTDSGSWAISIDVQGKVSGCLNSVAALVVSGSVGTSGLANTIAGNTNTGAKFTGNFTLDGKVSGPWANATDGTSGTYSGTKTTTAPACGLMQQPGGPGGPGGNSNVLTLTNGDAAVLGGKLTITERAFRPGLNGSVKTLISTSDGILKYILAILGEIPTPAAQPPAYGVVINTVDIGTEIDISMRVNQNGKSYSYVCGGAFVTKCKNITFDATSRTVTYTNVIVEAGGGDDAQGLLTLNGTLTWMVGDAK
ncbi:MAG: hypothetical protein ACC657_11005, partial [Thiohalomonadales bacterium]